MAKKVAQKISSNMAIDAGVGTVKDFFGGIKKGAGKRVKGSFLDAGSDTRTNIEPLTKKGREATKAMKEVHMKDINEADKVGKKIYKNYTTKYGGKADYDTFKKSIMSGKHSKYNISDRMADGFKNNFTNVTGGSASKLQGRYQDTMSAPLTAAMSYLSGDGSKGLAAARIGTIGAGAVGLRYMGGGNMTTNSRGERDIAGIPFI